MILLLLMGCPEPLDTADTDPSAACDESTPGTICTWAGQAQAGFNGESLDRRESWLYFPIDVEFSEFGPPTIVDWNNHRIRIVNEDDTLTTVMGSSFVGDGPADLSDRTAPGAIGTTVNLNHPTDVIYLPDGRLLSSSWHTHKLRIQDLDTLLTYVRCGSTPGFVGDNGEPAATALFNQPKAAVYDERTGTTYIVDMRNERVRALSDTDTITTVAGNGEKGFTADGVDARDTALNFPKSENPRPGGAITLAGDLLYIADTENHRIRTIDLVTGLIDTVVGTGESGYGGDGGSALEAQINHPMDIEVEDGVLYIADTDNHVIRAVDLGTGIINTVVGTGEIGDAGDGGPPLEAELYSPSGIDVDLEGNLYIADFGNHRIRRVTP